MRVGFSAVGVIKVFLISLVQQIPATPKIRIEKEILK
jgi:hypothetical protein